MTPPPVKVATADPADGQAVPAGTDSGGRTGARGADGFSAPTLVAAGTAGNGGGTDRPGAADAIAGIPLTPDATSAKIATARPSKRTLKRRAGKMRAIATSQLKG